MTATTTLHLQGMDQLGGPAWLRQLREDALKQYEVLPFPTQKVEQWRKTDPERVRPEAQKLLKPVSSFGYEGCAQPHSCEFKPVEEAPEGLLFSLAKLEKTNHFALLSGATAQGGSYVHVPKDTSTGEGALFAHHKFTGPGLAATHTYINVESHASATIVEVLEADDSDILAAPVVEINVKAGARLCYVFVNQWGKASNVVPTIQTRVEKDAHCQVFFVGFGTALTKCFIESDLVGEGCKSEVLGLVLGQGRQHFDVDAQQNHRAGNTVSDVLFHVALTDRARSIFAGNILCEPGCQKIDGYQQNRNMLLSSNARADSMPRLEIEANDVRCTHGASFSSYDKAQKFYLQARGLSEFEAERLLVTGFFQAVIGRVDHAFVSEWLEKLLEDKMAAALGERA